METGGPGIQSLGALNINFVYFVQHTGPLKKNSISFLCHPTQGLFLAQEGVRKWAPKAMASTIAKLSTLIFGILYNI